MESDKSVKLSSGRHATYQRLEAAPEGVTWVLWAPTSIPRMRCYYAYAPGEHPFGTPGPGARYQKVEIPGRPNETSYWERV